MGLVVPLGQQCIPGMYCVLGSVNSVVLNGGNKHATVALLGLPIAFRTDLGRSWCSSPTFYFCICNICYTYSSSS